MVNQNVSSDQAGKSSTQNNEAILTLDEAVNSAIENSYDISINKQKVEMLEEKRDFYKDAGNDDDMKSFDDLIDIFYDLARIQHGQADQNETFLEDKVRKEVTTQYNSIVIAEKELEQINKNIEVTNIDYENVQLKKTLGLSIDTDVQSAQLDVEKLKNQKKSKEEAIKGYRDILSILIGKDVDNYALEDKIQYKPLVIEGSIDDYMDEKIDTYLMYQKKMVEWNEDNEEDTNKEPSEPKIGDYTTYIDKTNDDGTITKVPQVDSKAYATAMASYISGYGTYLENQYTTDTSLDNYNSGKRKLKQSMITMNASLKDLETQIDTLQKTLDLTKKQMDNLKAMCDVGLQPIQDYNKQVLNVKNVEINLSKLIDSYNTLKTGIQEPWTLQ